jgi:hypothetical protein
MAILGYLPVPAIGQTADFIRQKFAAAGDLARALLGRAPMRVVKRVVKFPSGFSFPATLAARSATEWSGVARASGGFSITT